MEAGYDASKPWYREKKNPSVRLRLPSSSSTRRDNEGGEADMKRKKKRLGGNDVFIPTKAVPPLDVMTRGPRRFRMLTYMW